MYVTIIDLLAVSTGSFARVFAETMTGREMPLVREGDETAMFIIKVLHNVEARPTGITLVWFR